MTDLRKVLDSVQELERRFDSLRVRKDTDAFVEAKKFRDDLEAQVAHLSKTLRAFPSGPMGLTPDSVKASPEYKKAKQEYDTVFGKLRNFNEQFLRTFPKEIKAERLARRGG